MQAALTAEQAKAAGYSAYAQHLPQIPCPRLTQPGVYCATCMGPMAQRAASLPR